jgi:nucleoside-diphosphate-sugar epimerase
MVKNKPITINGGYQTRDFVYVDDVINCIYKSLIKTCRAPTSDYVNILTGVSTSIDTLVDILSKKLRYSGVKEYKPLEKGDVELSTGTQEKMMRLFNLNHADFTELEVGLINTVDFLKKDRVDD